VPDQSSGPQDEIVGRFFIRPPIIDSACQSQSEDEWYRSGEGRLAVIG
jgi:hypothetical protein